MAPSYTALQVSMKAGKGSLHSHRVSALQAFWPGLQVAAGDLAAAKAQFEECERHGACMVLPHSMRPVTPSMEGGNSAVNAAAAAMDRMFDFSAW